MKRTRQFLFGALAAIAVASCGGGGGGGSLAEGGIGGTGISSGSISAFGSVVVNGTKFDVDAATITVNGDTGATQADLDVGYVVRVDGDLDDGVAGSVRFDADLIGEVDDNQIPATGDPVGTLVVMQQDVEITPTTVIAGGTSPRDIQDQVNDGAPDHVLVSGFRNSADVLVATHLEVLASAPSGDQVVGRVTPNSTFGEFRIGGLTVLSFAQPEVGDRVLVRGDYDPVAMEFDADANGVEPVEALATTGAEVELEGIVDTLTDPSNFTVDGVPVDASGAVIVDETGAAAAGQLAVDVEVEVEGVFDTNGVLVADRVEVELEDNVEIVARVANDPGVGGPVQFFNAGTPRLTAAVTAKTQLKDSAASGIENFAVEDLAQGDWVELDAFEDGAGNVTALKIERFDPEVDEKVVVEGLVDSKSDPIVEVLGMTFDTTGTGFAFSTIDPGDTVQLEWSRSAMFVQPNMPVDDIEKEN